MPVTDTAPTYGNAGGSGRPDTVAEYLRASAVGASIPTSRC
jgi:hypothetical protein